jgi:hypothetical protein
MVPPDPKSEVFVPWFKCAYADRARTTRLWPPYTVSTDKPGNETREGLEYLMFEGAIVALVSLPVESGFGPVLYDEFEIGFDEIDWSANACAQEAG